MTPDPTTQRHKCKVQSWSFLAKKKYNKHKKLTIRRGAVRSALQSKDKTVPIVTTGLKGTHKLPDIYHKITPATGKKLSYAPN